MTTELDYSFILYSSVVTPDIPGTGFGQLIPFFDSSFKPIHGFRRGLSVSFGDLYSFRTITDEPKVVCCPEINGIYYLVYKKRYLQLAFSGNSTLNREYVETIFPTNPTFIEKDSFDLGKKTYFKYISRNIDNYTFHIYREDAQTLVYELVVNVYMINNTSIVKQNFKCDFTCSSAQYFNTTDCKCEACKSCGVGSPYCKVNCEKADCIFNYEINKYECVPEEEEEEEEGETPTTTQSTIPLSILIFVAFLLIVFVIVAFIDATNNPEKKKKPVTISQKSTTLNSGKLTTLNSGKLTTSNSEKLTTSTSEKPAISNSEKPTTIIEKSTVTTNSSELTTS